MKLVVGLGNPGRKYEGTRHNVGFSVLAELARRQGATRVKTAFRGEIIDTNIEGERTLLLCPQTFMNLSGGSVLEARTFYKLENQDILIVCDDFHLPLAKVRIRAKGSAGGQKGLADIIRCLGSEEIPRLRLGIGQPPDSWDPADFVLSKFTKKDRPEFELAVQVAADMVEVWIRHGVKTCMNQFN